jgi:predicted ATPase
MRIKRLFFNNKNKNLIIHPIDFKDLTLLVGVSGVGKTQIIKSILELKSIANGNSVSGFNWEIEFVSIKGDNYIWKGGFEVKSGINEEFIDEDSDEYKKNRPKISFEELFINSKEVIKRNGIDIVFNGTPTVKLSQQQSVINLLKEEDLISDAYNAFNKIIFSDQRESVSEPYKLSIFNVSKLENKYKSLNSIQELDEDIRIKLYLTFKNVPDIFAKIKERFIEVFPQVDDLKISPIQNEFSGIMDFLKEQPFIHIKEKGISEWIPQGQISSGMFRTLLHISEMYLSAKGTVIIIDEFENSLGINCIDELTGDLVSGIDHKIQFIITSHHPYIINNIDFSNWKIITRRAGEIKAYDAIDLNIGKSKHDAFIQLINIDAYSTGINY